MKREIPTCYLCKRRHASARKSHFTPSTATEEVFGERNKEEVYTIMPDEVKVETYFGRENSQNTDPTIKKDPLTHPYVFCKECEENLSKIENSVVSLLNEATKQIKDGSVKIKRTAGFQKCIELPIHANIVSLYLYSVVWRQSFQQIFEGQDEVLSSEIYEVLREVISRFIELPIAEIIKSKEFTTLPNIICYTTFHGDESKDAVNPNGRRSNPQLFFMGNYDCLIFNELPNTGGFIKATGLKINLKDKTSFINQNVRPLVLLIPLTQWQKKRALFFENESSKISREASIKVANHRGIHPMVAKKMLHEKAHEIEAETKKSYSVCFEEALTFLLK